MPKYTCERCLKEFSQKSHFDKHQNKKLPCQDNKGKVEKIVENIIKDTLSFVASPRKKNLRLKLFAWLVATERLLLRFAFPKHIEEP